MFPCLLRYRLEKPDREGRSRVRVFDMIPVIAARFPFHAEDFHGILQSSAVRNTPGLALRIHDFHGLVPDEELGVSWHCRGYSEEIWMLG